MSRNTFLRFSKIMFLYIFNLWRFKCFVFFWLFRWFYGFFVLIIFLIYRIIKKILARYLNYTWKKSGMTLGRKDIIISRFQKKYTFILLKIFAKNIYNKLFFSLVCPQCCFPVIPPAPLLEILFLKPVGNEEKEITEKVIFSLNLT